ncbi:hypothetical protein EVG20_g9290 [Dentipellis fragilis]|uniref:Uncharacterized protein n=1 Tax=Dentipellis fragilis TaxID=205917 RepID=A0A4Y9XZK2_9AGAM|nr:hypothetical protein EVG20_g9290 [Dentipellis fragilis]
MFWLANARPRPGVVSGSFWARCTQQRSQIRTSAAARAFSFAPHSHRHKSGWLPRVPSSQYPKNALSSSMKAFYSQPSMEQQTSHHRPTHGAQRPAIGWRIAAALAASGIAYYAAASRTNSTTRSPEQLQAEPALVGWISRTEKEELKALWSNVRMVAQLQLVTPIRDALSSVPEVLQDVCAFVVHKYRSLRLNSEGARAVVLITGVNVAIWLAWKVPRLRPFMRAHFTHDPLSGKVYTRLTSIFSHKTLLEILRSTLLLYTLLWVVSVLMEGDKRQRGHVLYKGRRGGARH